MLGAVAILPCSMTMQAARNDLSRKESLQDHKGYVRDMISA